MTVESYPTLVNRFFSCQETGLSDARFFVFCFLFFFQEKNGNMAFNIKYLIFKCLLKVF